MIINVLVYNVENDKIDISQGIKINKPKNDMNAKFVITGTFSKTFLLISHLYVTFVM